ncbi:ATP-dependent RNA helicase [Salpingoeca rosetta]|uniref:ATP-dependent RNA helicase n=1 Tax=Salpingoeca rosetta (strain ATCC 50818 / BSB-021) TaxID=946362 RepID=F2UKY0_SALR5|nr:ATP-dependent RNA helicase [Salpingoeca rosetta]EGD77779.1 ATP-dependent RNA helicase [Salpingoeca rosetta]|eukprot:XP_004990255.1 ATP-dependent RNA helicase [Salpingoeca rosetta]
MTMVLRPRVLHVCRRGAAIAARARGGARSIGGNQGRGKRQQRGGRVSAGASPVAAREGAVKKERPRTVVFGGSIPFSALPLPAPLQASLGRNRFAQSTVIQREAYKPISKGRDVVIAAETGTGKTLAYLLPTMARLLEARQHKQQQQQEQQQQQQQQQAKVEVVAAETVVVDHGRPRPHFPRALIIAPTRDLARQTYRVARSLAQGTGLRVVGIVGDADSDTQKALDRPADALITVPGRLHTLTSSGVLQLADVQTVVLDEADVMLEDFRLEVIPTVSALRPDIPIPEAELIPAAAREHTPTAADTAKDGATGTLDGVASDRIDPSAMEASSGGNGDAANITDSTLQATSAADVDEDTNMDDEPEVVLARRIAKLRRRTPATQTTTAAATAATAHEHDNKQAAQVVMVGASIASPAMKQLGVGIPRLLVVASQTLHRVPSKLKHDFVNLKGPNRKPDKLLFLCRQLRQEGKRAIIFCNTADTVAWGSRFLEENGLATAALTGTMSKQTKRENVHRFVDTKDVHLLICTDMVARGMNFDVDVVVNFDLPLTSVDYLHRCGRTARIGKSGHVINLVSRPDRHSAHLLKMAIKAQQPLDGVYSADDTDAGTRRRSGHGGGKRAWYTAKIVGQRRRGKQAR